LVQYQEEVFNRQIHKLVPSDFYLTLLKYFVGWFNRESRRNVPVEYRQEILGVSSRPRLTLIISLPPISVFLNYHAAHDIGHALQNMSLVGCSSFAVWSKNRKTAPSSLPAILTSLLAMNFARTRYRLLPTNDGYPFMMVTFGGMTGVLSGMNAQGLTVYHQCGKVGYSVFLATPVSIVATRILQYASTFDEAYAIAAKRRMFVSESFLNRVCKRQKKRAY